MASIAFIGVGNMGSPMVLNLVRAGHQVTAFDVNSDALKALAAEGVATCQVVTEAVRGADYVISMLPNGAIARSVYLEQGVLAALTPETLVIDCSTIAPEDARALAEAGRERGITLIDAPVSGGVAGAAAGTLTFIVGGPEAAFEKARVVLADMGKNIFHAGDHGAGQVAKICNNLLLAIHMAGTAEALQLGVDNGLDPKVLSEIMLQSSGRNWSLELYNPYPGVMENVPASREYSGGFMVNLMNKDLGLAMEAALQSRSATPMGSLAKSLYELLRNQGLGNKDFSAIQTLYQHDESCREGGS